MKAGAQQLHTFHFMGQRFCVNIMELTDSSMY